MEFLTDLWLPILLSALALHISSFIAWVVLPHHFSDKMKIDGEDKVMRLVKELDLAPGNYMFPYGSTKAEQATPEFQAKYNQGPVGCLDVYPKLNMGANLGYTLLYFLATAIVIGYITHVACPPRTDGTDFMKVFRFAGTVGVLTYSSSGILNRIWFKARMITDFVDGIVFGLILGLIFAVLYPYAVAAT
jgi:hypothetical protein